MRVEKDGVFYKINNEFILSVFLEAGFKEVVGIDETTAKKSTYKSKEVPRNGQTSKA